MDEQNEDTKKRWFFHPESDCYFVSSYSEMKGQTDEECLELFDYEIGDDEADAENRHLQMSRASM